MDTIKSWWSSFTDFCTKVVQWRSPATVPYILAVNGLFWASVFYAERDAQFKILAALAIMVFSIDVLFSKTHERSIIVQILLWPITDLWKTFAVIFCGIAIHQLGENEEEMALWASIGAVSCLLISPVYYYVEVNQKVKNGFQNLGQLIKSILSYCILRPIFYVYEGLKYIFLLKWIPGLKENMKSLGRYLYSTLDHYILQHIRYAGHKTAGLLRYWCYFHWLSDLKALLKRWIGDPMVEKLRRVREKCVYVFGGYWLAPLGRYCGQKALVGLKYLMGVGNKCAIAIGNSVVWPVAVFAYDQLKQLAIIVYDVAGRPVVNVVHEKYKIAEDYAFINVLGPTAKTIIESVPEKNPFCDDTDEDLKEFLPGQVMEDSESDESESESDSEYIPTMPRIEHPRVPQSLATVDDLDDDSFLVSRLNTNFSCSDSSDEEFKLFSSREKSTRRRKRKATVDTEQST